MYGTLYSPERMELLKTAGYKHKVCDYGVVEKLKQNDPNKVFEKAARAFLNPIGDAAARVQKTSN
jgi:predicted house-cleaning NTP pyrophosphatase (Maf/HAM1 superfamily)